jgi:iron(III) transport system substrate-binding protein
MQLLKTLLTTATLFSLALPAAAEGVVNVYSYRQPALVQPLFDAFTQKTGIAVKMLFADKGLIERMEQEGVLSPVDVLLTSDVGRLVQATEKGLAQPVKSKTIDDSVPATLRAADGSWFGLTLRARVVYVSSARVAQTTISYEELADAKWKGRLCIRAADHPYNLALIADMIAQRGLDSTREWLLGVKANLAHKPSGDDRGQAKNIFAGECDIALGNSYYVGVMTTNDKEPEQKEWAKAIKVLLPSSSTMATHINISGMLMAKNAPDHDAALALMEYLANPEAQKIYADQNFEYPANPNVPPVKLVEDFGPLQRPAHNIGDFARHQVEAAKLVQETGINQ